MRRHLGLFLVAFSVSLSAKTIQISGGVSHTCALVDHTNLYCWGTNNSGQLGTGTAAEKLTPGVVFSGEKDEIMSFSTGDNQTCAVFKPGKVKCWGINSQGQLGLGLSKAAIGRQAGEKVEELDFVNLGKDVLVKKVATGAVFTCALTQDHQVKCWGSNSIGQLGLGDKKARGNKPEEMGDNLPFVDLGDVEVMDISVGANHTCALLKGGQMKCWGEAYGIGSGANKAIGANPTDMGNNLKPVDLGKGAVVKEVSVGQRHTCVLLTDYQIKCFGDNSFGALGNESSEVIGMAPNQMGDKLKAVKLADDLNVEAMKSGRYHVCAVLDNGALKCWGYNQQGQLGLGDTILRGNTPGSMGEGLPYADLEPLYEVKELSIGHFHTCAELTNGQVKCWGYNAAGQLGIGVKGRDVGVRASQMGKNLAGLTLP